MCKALLKLVLKVCKTKNKMNFYAIFESLIISCTTQWARISFDLERGKANQNSSLILGETWPYSTRVH